MDILSLLWYRAYIVSFFTICPLSDKRLRISTPQTLTQQFISLPIFSIIGAPLEQKTLNYEVRFIVFSVFQPPKRPIF